MHITRLVLVCRLFPAAMILLMATGSAPANYYELLRRVPDSANAIILIDVPAGAIVATVLQESSGDIHWSADSEPFKGQR